MLMRYQHSRRKPISDINVVPYIDVMLVLLIIFMITAPMLTQGVKVELPEVTAEPLPLNKETDTLIVSVKADGSYYLSIGDDEKPVELEKIGEQVSKILRQQPKTPVLINGDKSVSYDVVVQLMARLQAAGVPSVGLITDLPDKK